LLEYTFNGAMPCIGNLTIGLASHLQSLTDTVVYPSTDRVAYVGEIGTYLSTV